MWLRETIRDDRHIRSNLKCALNRIIRHDLQLSYSGSFEMEEEVHEGKGGGGLPVGVLDIVVLTVVAVTVVLLYLRFCRKGPKKEKEVLKMLSVPTMA